jgi:peptidyl-tRNA hydrolase
MSHPADAPSKDQYLYVLVRSDLSPGLQLAQASHGVAEFALAWPGVSREWIRHSNYIVVLAVPDQDTLLEWADLVYDDGHPYLLVFEPDIDQHTALVIGPGPYHARLSSLPLAGKEAAMV